MQNRLMLGWTDHVTDISSYIHPSWEVAWLVILGREPYYGLENKLGLNSCCCISLTRCNGN